MKNSPKSIWHFALFVLIFGRLSAQTSLPKPFWATKFEKIRPSEGVYIVSKDEKMGVVTSTGKLLTRIEYDTIYNFSEGMAIVGRGHREVNEFGKVLSDFKYGYINKAGRLVVSTNYEIIDDFSEGVGHVKPSLRQDVWFDKQGKIVISSPDFVLAESFKGNMAYVEVAHLHKGFGLNRDRNNNPFDVRGNYIDHQGRLLVPWKYDTIAPYYPGYLRAVRKDGKWGFLDSTARLAVPLVYDDIDADSAFFWQNRQRVGQARRYGFMDAHTGMLLILLQFESTLSSQTAIVWGQKNGQWGCIDSSGHVVIPFQYADANPFDAQGRAVVKQRGKWGLIDTAGKMLTSFRYDNILPFQEERAIVKRDNKYGFIDLQGREVIPAHYDRVSQFSDGQAFAKRWGLFITVDNEGNWIQVKFQTATLLWLIISLICLIAIGWMWYKNQVRLRHITT